MGLLKEKRACLVTSLLHLYHVPDVQIPIWDNNANEFYWRIKYFRQKRNMNLSYNITATHSAQTFKK